jgi:beta-phosphoglucomutase-like phosphatase (HAD superfamily)
VLTDTARVHAAAWKAVFDTRSSRGGRNGMVWPLSHLISKLTTSILSMGDRATTAFEAFRRLGA